MKLSYLLLISCLVLATGSVRADEGLPPTNIGPHVGQPGDRIYTPAGQLQRHSDGRYFDKTGTNVTGPIDIFQPSSQVPGASAAPPPQPYKPAPRLRQPDVSIEPIVSDEPIPQPGFPPMPMSLDLPLNRSEVKALNPTLATSSEEGSRSYGPPPVQRSGYRVNTPAPVTRYNGEEAHSSSGTTGKGATAAPLPKRAEASAGREAVSHRSIKELGGAPKLSDNDDMAPEAPDGVLLHQSPSQDVSLPDDESVSRNFKNGKGNRYVRNAARRGKQFGKNLLRSTGVPVRF